MDRFKVKWRITLEKEFEGKDMTEIEEQTFDMDCQHEGEYISGSFEIISIQKEQLVKKDEWEFVDTKDTKKSCKGNIQDHQKE